MNPYTILILIACFLFLLFAISYFTSKKANHQTFFTGNRQSPWYLVAFGMIGTSLSGVTFISLPGWVGTSQFSYMQMVLGYLAGYYVIANILMPIYYKLNLTSIYSYLDTRFGRYSSKTGASFFLLSRTVGSALRLYLSAYVLQIVLFQYVGIPFWATVSGMVLFIYLYTLKGGIKTVVWTDTLQTALLLASLVSCLYLLSQKLNWDFTDTITQIAQSKYSQIFFWDNWNDKRFFIKQFLGGMFIAITMTGLDQDLMQKNLTCRNLKEAKRNMYWFSFILIPVNLLFLSLGAILYLYVQLTGGVIPAKSDDLFPMIAMSPEMPYFFMVIFILGLVSCTYSSADSALTALTTSFTFDILQAQRFGEKRLLLTKSWVHLAISIVLILLILLFYWLNDQSIINTLFTVAGYTYGPLLGLYAFGLFTKKSVKDRWVPIVAILSPIITWLINKNSMLLFNGYEFGFELLILNGLITAAGLYLIKR